jgi:hypothetical protein
VSQRENGGCPVPVFPAAPPRGRGVRLAAGRTAPGPRGPVVHVLSHVCGGVGAYGPHCGPRGGLCCEACGGWCLVGGGLFLEGSACACWTLPPLPLPDPPHNPRPSPLPLTPRPVPLLQSHIGSPPLGSVRALWWVGRHCSRRWGELWEGMFGVRSASCERLARAPPLRRLPPPLAPSLAPGASQHMTQLCTNV